MEQPVFGHFRTETTLILRNGERVLLGMLSTIRPVKYLELFRLKAEAIPVE